MVDFSIIVPVYQSRKYLKRLVNSVLAQNYPSYELLLVDDGSSDGSENICDEFSKKYSQIKTIHKKNGGVSSARNEGIHRAEGEYVIFLDADDYIEKGLLAETNTAIKQRKPDVLVFGYYYETHNSVKKFLPKLNGNYTYDSLAKEFSNFALESSFNCTCNKVFRADIIKEKKLEFPIQKIAEDGVFVCRFLRNANSIYFSKKAYYHYCQNEDSAVHKFCASRWQDENKYLKEMKKCVEYFAPDQTNSIMGVKYRNALLFDLYNLLVSDMSIYRCSRILSKHLEQNYDYINWDINTNELLLNVQIKMLQKKHILELITLMRFKKKIGKIK